MKFAQFKKGFVIQGVFIAAAGALTGCSGMNTDSASSSAASEIQMTGQINTGAGAAAVQAKMAGGLAMAAASTYSISCVTLTSPAKAYSSSIASDGAFAIKLPANTSVGCFVVDTASQTPVASLYVEAAQATMGSSLASSMNLSKDANLGSVDLDLEKHEVRVPKARIAESENKDTAKVWSIDDMNNSAYLLKCVPTGNAIIDANCQQKLENNNSSDTVYFRVLKAVQNGADIKGLGVWESAKAYADCGSIDLSGSDVIGAAQNQGITFPYADKVSLGGDFTIDNVLCPLRNPQGPQNTWQNIRKYYALGGVEQSADGYSLHVETEEFNDQNCKITHKLIVHFGGKSADKLNGQFYSTTYKQEIVPGGCGQYQPEDDHFIISLTKQ